MTFCGFERFEPVPGRIHAIPGSQSAVPSPDPEAVVAGAGFLRDAAFTFPQRVHEDADGDFNRLHGIQDQVFAVSAAGNPFARLR